MIVPMLLLAALAVVNVVFAIGAVQRNDALWTGVHSLAAVTCGFPVLEWIAA